MQDQRSLDRERLVMPPAAENRVRAMVTRNVMLSMPPPKGPLAWQRRGLMISVSAQALQAGR